MREVMYLYLHRYLLRLIALCALFFSFFAHSNANVLKGVNLVHRDAVDIQRVVSPLLPEGSTVSIDKNTLLISAPNSFANSLVALIKKIDKPQQQLSISIFRGKYPLERGVIVASTDHGVNTQELINAKEGQPIVITETSVLKIATSDARYIGHVTPVMDPPVAFASTDTVNVGSVLQNILTAIESSVVMPTTNTNSDLSAFDALSAEKYELVDVSTGMYLRVSLKGDKQAYVSVRIISKNDGRQYDRPASQGRQLVDEIGLTNSVETLVTVSLGQWFNVSDSTRFSHRPVLNSRRQVYSTETADDSQSSIWIKVVRKGG